MSYKDKKVSCRFEKTQKLMKYLEKSKREDTDRSKEVG